MKTSDNALTGLFKARSRALLAVLAIALSSAMAGHSQGQSVRNPKNSPAVPQNKMFPTKTIGGVITDTQCGARHAKDSTMSAAECARFCVRNGARYILVDGDKTYQLKGDFSDLGSSAGQRVFISGTVQGNILNVGEVKLR